MKSEIFHSTKRDFWDSTEVIPESWLYVVSSFRDLVNSNSQKMDLFILQFRFYL